MILTQAQARAVYDAMAALNNVDGTCRTLHVGHAIISTDFAGQIWIYDPKADENYANPAAFAAAYGLN